MNKLEILEEAEKLFRDIKPKAFNSCYNMLSYLYKNLKTICHKHRSTDLECEMQFDKFELQIIEYKKNEENC